MSRSATSSEGRRPIVGTALVVSLAIGLFVTTALPEPTGVQGAPVSESKGAPGAPVPEPTGVQGASVPEPTGVQGAPVPEPIRASVARAFPDAQELSIVPISHFLSDAQLSALQERWNRDEVPGIVVRYEISSAVGELGHGYVDTHRVRTLPESVLIVLGREGTVRHVDVLAFAEPPEYKPAARWYEQFDGLARGDALKYGREIHAVTGATLTGRATVDAVARVSVLHRLLMEESGGSDESSGPGGHGELEEVSR